MVTAALSSDQEGSTATDRKALIALFSAARGSGWSKRMGWCTSADLKDWSGVSVNDQGRVVLLLLSDRSRLGSISVQLGTLRQLTVLSLCRNHFAGSIPRELGNLRHLTTLSLSENALGGSIPRELGKLSQLTRLLLDHNVLTGSIPSEIGNLSNLERLRLHNNKLTGAIPAAIGKLGRLSSLELGNNMLEGEKTSFCRTALPVASQVFTYSLLLYPKRNMDLVALGLDGNPLLRPPQTVMSMGVTQAIAWWKDIGRFGEGTSNKLKMVLVGLSEAGKTTVVRNITGRPIPKQLDRTVGIEITEGWKPVDDAPLEVSIWDFAGQADYYASHQIFLTKGSLFLLVVDLQALFLDSPSRVTRGGDPHGRVYRFLEMLHLCVPGAAVALDGTHTDAAEFKDPAKLDEAVNRLEQLIARYNDDKRKEVANIEALPEHSLDLQEDHDTKRGEVLVDHQPSIRRAPAPPVIHDKVFRTSLERNSTIKLVKWIGKAATGRECPAEFHFPGVRATIPTAWIEAMSAMDGLKEGEYGKRYVTWADAVHTFDCFMKAKGTAIPDAEHVLRRAMRHREAEGGVLLSREGGPDDVGEITGMLYLDPTWLIEFIRRLTDHNLVDPSNQGTLTDELEKYGDECTPRLDLDMLWTQHRSYRASGTLDLAYLRFLWLHRQLDGPESKLQLTVDEFNSVLATMEALLVLYRAPSTEASNRPIYVVPARLPEYGDEQVLEKGGMGLGDVVVRARCSFRRSYAPSGIIGRFLAFSNAHILEARECWQHGAHLIWMPGAHDVLVHEAQCVGSSDNHCVDYPGLVLCVKGSTPAVREVLYSLTEEVRNLLKHEVHGFPGLCSVVFGDTDVVHVRDITSSLRMYLNNRFDQLGATIRKVAGITSEVLQALYLAADEENQYPRLILLKPETTTEAQVDVWEFRASGSSVTVGQTGQAEEFLPSIAEAMQHGTWNKWIRALRERRKIRMVFVCEHDMTEIKCGPDGRGYLIQDLRRWVKGCLPLLQSASTEFLDAAGTSVSVPGIPIAAPPRKESAGGGPQQPPPDRVQKQAYEALCRFMQTVENPSNTCCGLRSRCSNCGSVRGNGCVCISWRAGMVRVPNGKGGLVWVKKSNEEVYAMKIAREGRG